MTAKLLAFYTQPDNPDEFDRRYFEEHVPLVKKMPGLQSVSVVKLQKNLMGGELPYYMVAELVFADMAALKGAMASPEGQAAGANIMSFGARYLTMCSAEVPEAVPV